MKRGQWMCVTLFRSGGSEGWMQIDGSLRCCGEEPRGVRSYRRVGKHCSEASWVYRPPCGSCNKREGGQHFEEMVARIDTTRRLMGTRRTNIQLVNWEGGCWLERTWTFVRQGGSNKKCYKVVWNCSIFRASPMHTSNRDPVWTWY